METVFRSVFSVAWSRSGERLLRLYLFLEDRVGCLQTLEKWCGVPQLEQEVP